MTNVVQICRFNSTTAHLGTIICSSYSTPYGNVNLEERSNSPFLIISVYEALPPYRRLKKAILRHGPDRLALEALLIRAHLRK